MTSVNSFFLYMFYVHCYVSGLLCHYYCLLAYNPLLSVCPIPLKVMISICNIWYTVILLVYYFCNLGNGIVCCNINSCTVWTVHTWFPFQFKTTRIVDWVSFDTMRAERLYRTAVKLSFCDWVSAVTWWPLCNRTG